jgi:hypothetical protein
MRFAGMGSKRDAHKPEGRSQLGGSTHRWMNNIKMDFNEIECGRMDCLDVARDREKWRALANTVMNLWVP